MLFYSSCKVMFYNKNLLHSKILAFKNQIYQIPTHYIFHSRYLIIITVVILCQNGNSILQLSKHSLNSSSISPQCLFPPIFVCLSHSRAVPHRYDLLNQSIRKRRYFLCENSETQKSSL